jgi:hypothetical protein
MEDAYSSTGVLNDDMRADCDPSSGEWRLFENCMFLGRWKTFDAMLEAIRARYLTESVE